MSASFQKEGGLCEVIDFVLVLAALTRTRHRVLILPIDFERRVTLQLRIKAETAAAKRWLRENTATHLSP